MEVTMNYVPTDVGPTKLDEILAECPELSDESKEKLCIIQDIIKIAKALDKAPPTPWEFYYMYELSIPMLESLQHASQVSLNTERYHGRF